MELGYIYAGNLGVFSVHFLQPTHVAQLILLSTPSQKTFIQNMVVARFGDSISLEDAKVLGESLQMPFSGRVAKSRFLKGGKQPEIFSLFYI